MANFDILRMNHSLSRYYEFLEFLFKKISIPSAKKEKAKNISNQEIHKLCDLLEVSSENMAEYLADFCGINYYPFIRPEAVKPGILSKTFCSAHSLIPVNTGNNETMLVLSNPFDLDLLDALESKFEDCKFEIGMADAKTIAFLLIDEDSNELKEVAHPMPKDMLHSEEDMRQFPIIRTVSNIILAAAGRASDIHIEPKESHMVVRFRVDGDLQDIYGLKKETGVRLISRLKVLSGLDIAERRRPQDGSFQVSIQNKLYKLRLATTATPEGESLIIRVLDSSVKPKRLQELGMTQAQVETLYNLANRDSGFLLVVGPTGSGKTTTIYSLLAEMDCQKKSLLSIEDPVEYRIPFANQQQVNDKAGITFESLLKSTLRQDPDILFLGEIRDSFSAKTSFDFASTGHVTITSLHTGNATTAIFRLERLNISRESMADTILGIIAQRLIKKLCDHCKIVGPPTAEELEWLKRFSSEKLTKVAQANPRGCPKCNHTGYWGREGVYEIMKFDSEIADKIRAHKSISEIRTFIEQQGNYLMSHHAVDKVRELKFSPKDVYEKVLVEEPTAADPAENFSEPEASTGEASVHSKKAAGSSRVENGHKPSILVVEDDRDMQALIALYLQKQGYETALAQDGVEALLALGQNRFDLIISDINMPNFDGFKLLEMISQKGIKTPVLFLTGQAGDEYEVKGFELGAVDYIRKPVQKEIFLARVKKALKGSL